MKLNNIIVSGLIASTSLFASDLETNLNYFGDLTFNTLDKSGYTYRHFGSDDIENKVDYSSYSKLGGQLTLTKDDFDFVAQATLKRYENAFESKVNWLNLKYTYENFAIRAGKMQLPLFLNSNSLDVSYVHLWAKSPIEVYGIFPMKSYNGLELLYQKSFDNEIYLDLQVTPLGSIKEDVDMIDSFGSVEGELKNIRNIMVSLDVNNFSFKSTYTQGKINISSEGTGIDTLTSTLRQFGFDSLANKYSFENTKLEFFSFGIDYDNNKFIFNSEIAKMKSESFLPNVLSYYALAGYRIGKWIPFVMYAENKNDKEHFTEDELATNSTNPLVVGTIAGIKAGLEQELYKMNSSQKTTSLGFRYDYKQGIALKFQADRITTTDYGTASADGSTNGFLARDAGVEDEPAYLYTASLVFAF